MDTRTAYANVIKVIMTVIFFFSLMSMACDDPQPCGDACGLTAPWSDTTTQIINKVVPEQQNTLSGGNP